MWQKLDAHIFDTVQRCYARRWYSAGALLYRMWFWQVRRFIGGRP